MKAKAIVGMLLSASVIAVAQYNGAPVTVDGAQYVNTGLRGAMAQSLTGFRNNYAVVFTNTSDKKIIAIEFQLGFTNAVDQSTGSSNMVCKVTVKPHKRGVCVQPDLPNGNEGLNAVAVRVKFADGSLWEE